MLNKIKLKFFSLLSYAIGFFIKNKNDLWLIGAGNGYSYADNSRYLYEWISANKDKRIFWITKNFSLYQHLRINEKHKVVYYFSIKGIFLLARAGVYIYSHGNNDITPYVHKNKIVICLWHGLPIKKIGNMTKGKFGKDNKFNLAINKIINSRNSIDLFLSPSEFYKDIFHQSFGDRIKSYIFAQYPRVTELKDKWRCVGEKDYLGTIIFAPTFRDYVSKEYYEDFGILPPLEYLDELNAILLNENYQLIIKLHPYIAIGDNYASKFNAYSNIVFSDKNDDVLNLLIKAEILITDYSSIYFDFLSLNKEVLFLMPDYDVYRNNGRGLNFDFKEIAPGHIYTSWYDIAEYLQLRNRKFEPDSKYAYSLKISNEFELRTNEYIFREIENKASIK